MVMRIDPADKKAGTHLNSVERTLGILECLSGHHKINLERLAEETGLPKPTLHRFLSTLVNLGYVFRDENDQYSLTLRMFSVGSKGLSHMDLAQDARPVAEILGKDLGETVHMGVLDDDMAMYILKIESQYTIRMYSRVGKRIPLYCTAIGKILLADKTDDEAGKIIEAMDLVSFTRTTIVGKPQLLMELRQIRKNGFSEDVQEHEEGIRCIAAPVRDYSKRVIAGLSVSWPTFRFDETKREHYIRSVKESADVISALMGY